MGKFDLLQLVLICAAMLGMCAVLTWIVHLRVQAIEDERAAARTPEVHMRS